MDPNRLCMGCMRERKSDTSVCSFCGFDAERYEQERAGDVLPLYSILKGQYLIGRMVGRGGFGITYLGWHLELESKTAIKEYFPAGISTRDTESKNRKEALSVAILKGQSEEVHKKGLENFETEAQILAKYPLPGVVRIYDAFRENNTAYMVMEYVDGINLKEWMRKKQRYFTEKEAVEILLPVVTALEQLHQNHLIHRDISPDNIMISEDGKATLIDFGAARNILASKTSSVSVILKHGYAPPEQYSRKGKQGPWTDVYALCATLLFMLTGKIPEEAVDRIYKDPKEDDKDMQRLLSGKVSVKMENLLMHGLAVKMEKRIQDMPQLKEQLLKIKEQYSRNRTKEKKKRSLFGLGMIGTGLLAVLIGAGVFIWLSQSEKIHTEVVFSVTDPDGMELEGVKLSVRDHSGSKQNLFIDGEQAVCVIEKKGRYEAVVEKIPEEYQLSQKIYRFEAEKNGTIREENGETDGLISIKLDKKKYRLNVDGKVFGEYTKGEEVTLTAEERDGYSFVGWQVEKGNVTVGQSQTITFVMPAEAVTLIPIYKECSAVKVKVGERITFGSYEQDKKASNGPEPIQWEVVEVDGNKATLWSKEILDRQPYAADIGNEWEASGLRKWLNESFYNSAFTEEEQKAVLKTMAANSSDEGYKIAGGVVTEDFLFLPSVEEAERFGGTKAGSACHRLQCKATPYAVEQGVQVSDVAETKGNGSYWTRNLMEGAYIDITGTILLNGTEVDQDLIGVRPAFCIDLRKINEGSVSKVQKFSVTVDGKERGSFEAGETVYLQAVQKEGYTFTGWKVIRGDVILSGNEEASFTMKNSAVAIEAQYEQKKKEWKVGDTFTLGSYEQDNHQGNGAEAIQWEILTIDGTYAYVWSKDVLESREFKDDPVTATTWANSTIRDWLNHEFYSNAFTAEEQKMVRQMVVQNKNNAQWDTDGGADTNDFVFLPSVDEIKAFYNISGYETCEKLKKKPNAYCNAKGIFTLSDANRAGYQRQDFDSGLGNCSYWLRSPGYREDYVSYVNPFGVVVSDGESSFVDTMGIRPALWADLSMIRE